MSPPHRSPHVDHVASVLRYTSKASLHASSFVFPSGGSALSCSDITYTPGGSAPPTACAPGTFQDESGTQACIPCEPGTIALDPACECPFFLRLLRTLRLRESIPPGPFYAAYLLVMLTS
jgi:hypothetical protein